ncbi:hypothetical protein ANCC_16910 [Anaerostipes caccae L1-92]|nr:hypothetical protein ANCC_16910 [Anaerostipes caccae L1-92]
MQNGYDNKIKKTPVHTGIEKDGAGDEDGCVFSHLSAFCAGGRKCERRNSVHAGTVQVQSGPDAGGAE